MTPGTVLGEKYRLVSIMGEGGMGTVWRGEHLALGAPVAVKLLQAREASSAEARARFDAEAKVAASLRGPHVVQVFDFGFDAATGAPFIVMELLEGESLRERLLRGPLPPAEVARVVTHVARALTRAHERGVVHRDLKPANIFLVREGEGVIAKVLDFGIAKQGSLTLGRGLTTTGTLLGTPWYMSPEQIVSSKSVDFRADLWSLAVIAVESLTGRLPFDADNIAGLALAISSGRSTPPSQLGWVPSGVDAWFARATAARSDARFGSALELASALREVCGGADSSRDVSSSASGTDAPASASSPPVSALSGASSHSLSPLSSSEREPAEAGVDGARRGNGAAADSSSDSRLVGGAAAQRKRRGLKRWLSGGAALLVLALAVLGAQELLGPGSWAVAPASEPRSAQAALGERGGGASVMGAAPGSSEGGSSSVEGAPARSPVVAPLHEEASDAGAVVPPVERVAAASELEKPASPSTKRVAAPSAAVPRAAAPRAALPRAAAPATAAPRSAPLETASPEAEPLEEAASAEDASPEAAPPEPIASDGSATAQPRATSEDAIESPERAAAVARVLRDAAQRASACRPRGGPTGDGEVRVVFSSKGRVRSLEILTPRFRDTVTGSCIGIIFRRLRIGTFAGPEREYVQRFSIPESPDVSEFPADRR